MNRIYKLLLVVLVAGLLLPAFQSCKKYDDGPMFSLRSKKARVAGEWKFSSYIVNGNDETNEYMKDKIEFEKGGDVKYTSIDVNTGETILFTGTWEFDDGKESLTMTMSTQLTDNNGNKLTVTASYDCKIKELKNKEMKLDGTAVFTYTGYKGTDNIIIRLKQ